MATVHAGQELLSPDFLAQLERRVLLHLLLDALFQVDRGYLQELHQLDLLGREPLEQLLL